ncbi:MAG: LLM class flavin-dependent oxidoreductase [Nitriliruptorales bacterium]|nr:LLM class flavin-dependent oxidoreductase [Nitriliruptorales bacterium]
MARLGIGIGGPYPFLGPLAKAIEDRGFDSVWVPETTQDSIVQSAVLAAHTSSIRIGTDITLAFPRSPTITAMSAWDLCELTNDRFVIGLGSQVRRIIEDRFSSDYSQPAKRMAEYVQAMKTVWRMARGEDASFEGELYRVVHHGVGGKAKPNDRQMPKVFVAAVGPLMTKAAATHADGLLGHPFTSLNYITNLVQPRIEDALADAGRPREDFELVQSFICSISDDRQQAREEAKQQIAFYGTTPNYRDVFESNGEGHLTDQLREVFKKDPTNVEALRAAVPEEAVDRYAVAGTADEVRDRLAEYHPHADELMFNVPWYRMRPERMAEGIAAFIDVFGN